MRRSQNSPTNHGNKDVIVSGGREPEGLQVEVEATVLLNHSSDT